LQTKTFTRKTFYVEGVQVTRENIREVAEWCGGTIAKKLDDTDDIYIHVPVKQTKNSGRPHPSRAFIGYYVLKSSTGFRVYNPTGLEAAFEPVG
jgi:hypothetical protein